MQSHEELSRSRCRSGLPFALHAISRERTAAGARFAGKRGSTTLALCLAPLLDTALTGTPQAHSPSQRPRSKMVMPTLTAQCCPFLNANSKETSPGPTTDPNLKITAQTRTRTHCFRHPNPPPLLHTPTAFSTALTSITSPYSSHSSSPSTAFPSSLLLPPPCHSSLADPATASQLGLGLDLGLALPSSKTMFPNR
eukprot:6172149-Pleurochrysis_carterae.AAC.1